MTDVETSERPAGVAVSRPAAVWILLAGVIGELAAFVLAVEKIRQLQNPSYVPSCSINPVLSCGSVMLTKQASLFGFPNPLLGIAAFSVVIVTGVLAVAGVRLPRWYWAGLAGGTLLGAVFVHWLIYESLYEIGALCPYCMVVWVITMALLIVVSSIALRPLAGGSKVVYALYQWRWPLYAVWITAIALLILDRFWSYWSTLI
ncbi:vitamin K epoxide reductase family protein [Mycolicibacterium llatzerense]|uniref:vitamin K epoxide reductase family protein n=1 Tax=Mycolicibacterium llatzerense TaxID=280871 RepID=UPI0008DDDEBB|nr:vitamin K epoxide reductase family protein [Mycolicibacterium llatzerense]